MGFTRVDCYFTQGDDSLLPDLELSELRYGAVVWQAEVIHYPFGAERLSVGLCPFSRFLRHLYECYEKVAFDWQTNPISMDLNRRAIGL